MAVVTLYDRGIESMYEIRGLAESRIHSLNLHMNHIARVENLDGPVARALTELDLSSNNLITLDGLGGLTALQSLNVSANRLAALPDAPGMPSLTRIIASFNMLTSARGLSLWRGLEEVELDGNSITDLAELVREVKGLPALRKLSLQPAHAATAGGGASSANPVCAAPGYKATLLAALPRLTHLDGVALAQPCAASGAGGGGGGSIAAPAENTFAQRQPSASPTGYLGVARDAAVVPGRPKQQQPPAMAGPASKQHTHHNPHDLSSSPAGRAVRKSDPRQGRSGPPAQAPAPQGAPAPAYDWAAIDYDGAIPPLGDDEGGSSVRRVEHAKHGGDALPVHHGSYRTRGPGVAGGRREPGGVDGGVGHDGAVDSSMFSSEGSPSHEVPGGGAGQRTTRDDAGLTRRTRRRPSRGDVHPRRSPAHAAAAATASGDVDAADVAVDANILHNGDPMHPHTHPPSRIDAVLASQRSHPTPAAGASVRAESWRVCRDDLTQPVGVPRVVGVTAFVQTDAVVTHSMEAQTVDVVATERGCDVQADLLDVSGLRRSEMALAGVLAGLREALERGRRVPAEGEGEESPASRHHATPVRARCELAAAVEVDAGVVGTVSAALLQDVAQECVRGRRAAAHLAALREDHAALEALLADERRRADAMAAHKHLAHKLADARAANEHLEDALEKKTRCEAELAARLSAASIEIEAKGREVERLASENHTLLQQLAATRDDAARQTAADHTTQAAALQRALDEQAARLQGAAERAKQAHEADVARLREEFAEDLAGVRRGHERALHLEQQRAQDAIATLEAEMAGKDAKHDKALAKLAAGYKEQKARAIKYHTACRERQELTAQLERTVEARTAERDALREGIPAIDALRRGIGESRGREAEVRQRLDAAGVEIQRLREELARTNAGAAQQRQAAEALAAERDEARKLMATLQEDLHAIRGQLHARTAAADAAAAKEGPPASPPPPAVVATATATDLPPVRAAMENLRADMAARLDEKEKVIDQLLSELDEAKHDLQDALDSLEMEAEAKSRLEANLQASMKEADRAARDRRRKLEDELRARDDEVRELTDALHAAKADAAGHKDQVEEERAAARKLTIKTVRLEEENEALAAQLSRHGHDLKRKLRAVAEALQKEKQHSARVEEKARDERSRADGSAAAAAAAQVKAAELQDKVKGLEERHQKLQLVLQGAVG